MTTNSPEPSRKVPRPRPSGTLRRRDKALLVGLAAAVVTFAAISITVNALRPDVPTTSNRTTVDPRAQDSDYVIHLGTAAVPGMTQEQVIALGRSACASLRQGTSKAEVSAQLRTKGISDAEAGAVVTAAIEAYCPDRR